MIKELYVLPMPSSGLAGPEFKPGPGRSNTIRCEWEQSENSKITRVDLIFSNCWAVKITHYVAIDVKWIPLASDKVVDLGETDWLLGIKSNIAANRLEIGQLRQLMIYFNDGPLYEFICESFEIQENILPSNVGE